MAINFNTAGGTILALIALACLVVLGAAALKLMKGNLSRVAVLIVGIFLISGTAKLVASGGSTGIGSGGLAQFGVTGSSGGGAAVNIHPGSGAAPAKK